MNAFEQLQAEIDKLKPQIDLEKNVKCLENGACAMIEILVVRLTLVVVATALWSPWPLAVVLVGIIASWMTKCVLKKVADAE